MAFLVRKNYLIFNIGIIKLFPVLLNSKLNILFAQIINIKPSLSFKFNRLKKQNLFSRYFSIKDQTFQGH